MVDSLLVSQRTIQEMQHNVSKDSGIQQTTQTHNHGRLAERENDPTRKGQTVLPDTR